MKTRVVERHNRNCWARRAVLRGELDTAWGTVSDAFRIFRHGKIGRTRPYVVVRCNDPECPAEIAVELEDVLELLPRF